MATASAAIAEVYITKRTYKEKMKKMEKIEAGDKEAVHQGSSTVNKSKKNSSGGFFSGMFKKVHSSADVSLPETAVQSCDEKK